MAAASRPSEPDRERTVITLTATLAIRPARPEDDIRCGQIIAAATMASSLPDCLPHASAMFEDGSPLAPEGRRRLIAELPDFVAGFADVSINRGHVRYLFVDPDLPTQVRQRLAANELPRPRI